MLGKFKCNVFFMNWKTENIATTQLNKETEIQYVIPILPTYINPGLH